jgi:hypothetical protein
LRVADKKKLYTVIEDDRVGEILAAAIAEYGFELLERVFDALVWRIAREPDCGTKLLHPSGTEYRLVRMRPLAGVKNPTILARYTVDHKVGEATIDWIKVYPYDPKDAVSVAEYEL